MYLFGGNPCSCLYQIITELNTGICRAFFTQNKSLRSLLPQYILVLHLCADSSVKRFSSLTYDPHEFVQQCLQ